MRIHQLSKILANQIAAGEVIERPASVLKECIENSLDAGATQIDIEIENAGMGLIRITDNGRGIHKEDLRLALSRHATSKIQQVEDLFSISSLGFRGEALASMASVSKLRLLSRVAEEEKAWEIRCDGEKTSDILPCAHGIGTCIELRDLFYNVPVRRKFLRSEKTELYHLIEVYKKFALSHFEVAFNLKNNQRRLYTFSKTENEQQKTARIKKICGLNFVDQAVKIDVSYEAMRLWGWIGQSALAKRQADSQYFFINRRMVRDKLITHAVKNAYQTVACDLMGLYPSFLLHFEIPADCLDVNVHPTKHEVRFVEASLVHDFIEKCVKEALTSIQVHEQTDKNGGENREGSNLKNSSVKGIERQNFQHPVQSAIPKSDSKSDYLYGVSQAFKTTHPLVNRWLALEVDRRVYVVDLFAAKQKVFFHFMSTSVCHDMRKALLFPMVCQISTIYQTSSVDNLIRFLYDLGFGVRKVTNGLSLTYIPYFLKTEQIEEIINKITSLKVLNLAGIKDNLVGYIEDQNICIIPYDWLCDFFKQWIMKSPSGPWVCYDADELSQRIEEVSKEIL